MHQQRWQVNRARRCGSSEREKASQTGTRLTERTRVLIPEKARRIKRSESDESWRASVETRLNRDEVVEVGGCDDFVSRPISEMSLCSCQFLCIAHVWWVLIKIYLLTYLFLRCQTCERRVCGDDAATWWRFQDRVFNSRLCSLLSTSFQPRRRFCSLHCRFNVWSNSYTSNVLISRAESSAMTQRPRDAICQLSATALLYEKWQLKRIVTAEWPWSLLKVIWNDVICITSY